MRTKTFTVLTAVLFFSTNTVFAEGLAERIKEGKGKWTVSERELGVLKGTMARAAQALDEGLARSFGGSDKKQVYVLVIDSSSSLEYLVDLATRVESLLGLGSGSEATSLAILEDPIDKENYFLTFGQLSYDDSITAKKHYVMSEVIRKLPELSNREDRVAAQALIRSAKSPRGLDSRELFDEKRIANIQSSKAERQREAR